MDRTPVVILLRCFSRIDDAVINVRDLLSKFSAYNYCIVVVTNGDAKGFIYPQGQGEYFVLRIPDQDNDFHASGDAYLFRRGLEYAHAQGFQFAICLTSDTWLLNEALLKKYLSLLIAGKHQWISSQWTTPHEAGLDLVLLNVPFAIEQQLIWPKGVPPETWIYQKLKTLGPQIYGRIREIFPIEYPRHLWRAGFDPSGAFHCDLRVMYFPRAAVVTHHTESLPLGMASKKRYANDCVGRLLFTDTASKVPQRFWRGLFRRIYHWLDDRLYPIYFS